MTSITTIICWIGSCASLVTFHAVAGEQPEQGGILAPAVIKESLSIPEAELPGLIMRAEAKETDAALKVASYFAMYLGETNKGIHYYEIAAGNGSEKALHNLMMIFASFPEFFDFQRALQVRARLKVAVTARGGKMQTDGEWAYDMYLEHFVGYGNKRRGMLFLKYAANHGSDEAATELANVLSEDPNLAKLKKKGSRKSRDQSLRSQASRNTGRGKGVSLRISANWARERACRIDGLRENSLWATSAASPAIVRRMMVGPSLRWN